MASQQLEEYERRRPVAALRPFIAWYSGYRQAGVQPGAHRGLPSPYLTFILTLDEPLTMAMHVNPDQPPGQYETLIGGLHSRPALIAHDGSQSGIQLSLHPFGARALFGLPAGEIAGIDLDAVDVMGPIAAELQARVREAGTWAERFAVLDRSLLERANLESRPAAELGYAWQQLLFTGGRLSTGRLAEEVGWSSRHLGNRFAAEIGLTPKVAARVVRFDRARRRLGERAGTALQTSLADLAAECGYFDQAHLAREFHELAGCSPTRWVAEEFRNVQANPGPASAD